MLIIFDLDDTLYDCSGSFPHGKDAELAKLIVPFSGVVELLNELPGTKILVSAGEKSWQEKKIEVLAIASLFTEIMLCPEDKDKKDFFLKALEKFREDNVWVIGNKITSEIRYGNELGFKTRQICHRRLKV